MTADCHKLLQTAADYHKLPQTVADHHRRPLLQTVTTAADYRDHLTLPQNHRKQLQTEANCCRKLP